MFRDEVSRTRFRDEHLERRAGRRSSRCITRSITAPQAYWRTAGRTFTSTFCRLARSRSGRGDPRRADGQSSDDPTSTTWLYNHFAGRFFGHHNDQDLRSVCRRTAADSRFADAQVLTKSSRVEFFVDDFEQFMAVVWMILLHPNVHRFSRSSSGR